MTSLSSERAPLVSVVVPCLNEEQYLGGLLEALQLQERRPDEVIVVEGGSSDATVDIFVAKRAASSDVNLTLVPRPGASIPEALNAGVLQAKGDVIVRLDAHSVPSPNYIADALVHLRDPAVGVVGGVWSVSPGAASAVAEGIARAVSHPLGAGDAKYRIGRDLKTPLTVDTVPFGCFRRQLWRDLGGFDESLHVNEDYDFNYRAIQAGRCVFLDPKIRSTYYARPTIRALAKQYFRYGWWKWQMLRKHPSSLRWRQAVPAGFVGLLFILALSGLVVSSAWGLLLLILAVYGATVSGTSISLCLREGGWRTLGSLCAAFVTVHVCWGTGALLNVLTAARWPYTAPVRTARETTTPIA